MAANGARVAYYADTTASDIPLLLIHSINAAPSAIEMKPLFERYRGQRPVYAPDLPGFGASDRSEREYTAEFYADTLRDFLGNVVGGAADVVALSLSSEFAARAAITAPELFRTLTLISPTGLGKRQPPIGKTADRIANTLRSPLLGSGLYRLLTSKPSIRHFLNLGFVDRAPDELVDYAYLTSHQPGARNAPAAFLSFRLFTLDAAEKLYPEMERPALVLYDRDPNLSFERLPQLVETRPNWSCTRISPSLGLPHFEDIEAVAAALEPFWAEAANAPPAAD